MTKGTIRARFLRATACLAVGGTALQLSGCDPQVRSTLLTGLETTTSSLSTALIQAFFLSLQDNNTTGTTTGNTTGTTTP
jgi:hypothetical protein